MGICSPVRPAAHAAVPGSDHLRIPAPRTALGAYLKCWEYCTLKEVLLYHLNVQTITTRTPSIISSATEADKARIADITIRVGVFSQEEIDSVPVMFDEYLQYGTEGMDTISLCIGRESSWR
jgi:hypothetical protein